MQTMKMIKIEELVPSKTNPRKTFEQRPMDGLIASIKEKGIVQPILVRPIKDNFEIVTGERRYRAALAAALKEMPAMVKDISDQDALEIQVIENLHREDVHPLEEAEGYFVLSRKPGTTVAKIAEKIGQSEKYVYDRMKLLSLIKEAKDMFLANKFTAGHAIILARLSPAEQKLCLERDHGGVFQTEYAGHLYEKKEKDPIKPKTVRELQVWVDEHVRFIPDKVDQMIFPETANVLEQIKEKAEKIVSITENHYVQTSARNDERIIGPRSWTRADGKSGSKTCEQSITGVFVVGPGRGNHLKVCIAKEKCKIHWGSWQKERTAQASGAPKTEMDKVRAKRESEEKKREDDLKKRNDWFKRWDKAKPAIAAALATAIGKSDTGSRGILANIVFEKLAFDPKECKNICGRGDTAEEFLKFAVHGLLLEMANNHWEIDSDLLPIAKQLGVDLKKIVKEAVPEK